MTTLLFTHPSSLRHVTPNGHPERVDRIKAVNQILEEFEAPVIFITAYPERFLTGRPPEPAFLITKPFGVDSLKAVISQALFFDRRSQRRNGREAVEA